MISALVPNYIGSASDDSVVAFIGVFLKQMEGLHPTESDSCYYNMFPAEGASPGLSMHLDAQSNQDAMTVMGRIIQSSVHNPQPLPDSAKAGTLLATVIADLGKVYGNELTLLQQKPKDTAGREKVCAISISLYKDLQNLPERDASALLRYLLANQKSASPTP